MRDVDICADFEMFKVKVPIVFLGTVGFSLRREGRYLKEWDEKKYGSDDIINHTRAETARRMKPLPSFVVPTISDIHFATAMPGRCTRPSLRVLYYVYFLLTFSCCCSKPFHLLYFLTSGYV